MKQDGRLGLILDMVLFRNGKHYSTDEPFIRFDQQYAKPHGRLSKQSVFQISVFKTRIGIDIENASEIHKAKLAEKLEWYENKKEALAEAAKAKK